MRAEVPRLIGIVGGSCAGKTWLADSLQRALGSATRLSLDNFYRDRQHLSRARRAQINFDHPRAIDWPLVHSVLQSFLSGNTSEVPQYDFATHGRGSTVLLDPAPLVLVEGLWLFRDSTLRKLFSFKIFIRSSEELCLDRRLKRDVRERNRTEEQVTEQFKRHTAPMYEKYVAGQERWADVVLTAPIAEQTVEELAGRIRDTVSEYKPGI